MAPLPSGVNVSDSAWALFRLSARDHPVCIDARHESIPFATGSGSPICSHWPSRM